MSVAAKPGRPTVFTDDTLLDAAVSVFARRGYGAAHMSEIATAAGTTKPTLYARLGTKEEIYARAVRREANLLAECLLASYEAARGRPISESISLGTAALLTFCEERTDGFRLLFDGAIGGPAVDRDTLVLRDVRTGLADLMRANRGGRGLPDGPELDLIASIVGAIGIDAALYAVKHPEVDLPTARRVGEHILRAFLTDPDSGAWPEAAAG